MGCTQVQTALRRQCRNVCRRQHRLRRATCLLRINPHAMRRAPRRPIPQPTTGQLRRRHPRNGKVLRIIRVRGRHARQRGRGAARAARRVGRDGEEAAGSTACLATADHVGEVVDASFVTDEGAPEVELRVDDLAVAADCDIVAWAFTAGRVGAATGVEEGVGVGIEGHGAPSRHGPNGKGGCNGRHSVRV